MKLEDTAHSQHQRDPEVGALELLQPLLAHNEFNAAVTEVLSRLAHLLGCERASLGVVEGQVIKVAAVSQYYQGIKHAPLPEVAAAMEESLLQDATLTFPHPATEFPHIVVAHGELVRCNGLSSALTVPFGHDGKLTGAITLEQRQQAIFRPEQILFVEQLVRHAAPLVMLKWSLAQPWKKRCLHKLRQAWNGDGSKASRRMRAAMLGAGAAGLAALFLLPVSNQVSGQARLEASVQRVISAPIDGYLKEVRVRPGDRVQAQQLLAELNDESLRTEQRKLEAEVLQQENALAEAMVKGDRTQVAIRRAKLDEMTAQKDLIAQQLGRTQLTAPFDGVLIKGDLSQLLGSPLKRGDVLLTLSQGAGFRVVVEVPERDIADLQVGQRGTLVLAALPAAPFAVRVARITPVAGITSDGHNVFEVEAALDTAAAKAAASLVPGMKGVAKITTDNRPVGWQWLVRAWHALTFIVWSRLG